MKEWKLFIIFIIFIMTMGICSCDQDRESKKKMFEELEKNAKKLEPIMSVLKKGLEKEYPDEKIGVEIMNDDYLKVHFINSSLKKLSKEKKQRLAAEVGKKVMKYLPKTSEIKEGRLMFTVSKNYFVYKYYNELDHYDMKLQSDSQTDDEQKKANTQDDKLLKAFDQKSIDELIKDLYGDDSDRKYAELALIKKGKSSVIPMIKIINEKNEYVRCSVIYILGSITGKKWSQLTFNVPCRAQIEYAAEIGLGNPDYQLIEIM